MLESLSFTYDGIDSREMGVISANVSGGLFEESFISDRNIQEEKISGREKPYFFGVENSPFSFPIKIFFENMGEHKRREVARWLSPSYYKPLVFSGNSSRVFYCMPTGSTTISHNGIEQGYIQFEMRCDSPYSYTHNQMSMLYDYSDNNSSVDLEFVNSGDTLCEPIIHIEKVGRGDLSIVNKSDGGREFKLTDVYAGELIEIDCETKEVATNAGSFRYEDFNNNYLKFIRGVNHLSLTGRCRLQFKYEFKLLQG